MENFNGFNKICYICGKQIDDSNMKTLEQAKRYISQCLFSDDDWNQVLRFCHEKFRSGGVHRPKRGVYEESFGGFVHWFEDLPGQGDIVRYGKLIGLVGKCTPTHDVLFAYTGLQGQLIQKEMNVLRGRLSPVSPSDGQLFHQMMADAMLRYSVKLGMVVPITVPEDGAFVMVRMKGKSYHAIFKGIESSCYAFYYIEYFDSKTEVSALPIADCDISPASTREGLEMLSKFSCYGIMWNPREKAFFPVPLRAKYGEKYWYISDKFFVCQGNDLNTPLHNERYKNGNYFTSYAEALVFIKKLKDLRMELNKGYDL